MVSRRFSDPQFDFVFEATAECMKLQSIGDEYTTKIKIADQRINDNFDKQLHDPECQVFAGVIDSVLISPMRDAIEQDITQREQAVNDQLEGLPLHIQLIRSPDEKRIRDTYLSVGPQNLRQRAVKKEVRKADGVFRAALLGRNALLLQPLPKSGRQTNFGGLLVPVLRSDGAPNVSLSVRDKNRRDVMLEQSHLMSHSAYDEHDMQCYRKLAVRFR